jgi:hypothetical protein
VGRTACTRCAGWVSSPPRQEEESTLISIRRISLGGGFRYLMESVAAGDGAADRSSPLARYYAESGTPPGRFLGSGLADLDSGRGVERGTQVTEEHLRLMLVALADPVSGEPVGGAPQAPDSMFSLVDGLLGSLSTTLFPVSSRAHPAEHPESRAHPAAPPVAVALGADLLTTVPKVSALPPSVGSHLSGALSTIDT